MAEDAPQPTHGRTLTRVQISCLLGAGVLMLLGGLLWAMTGRADTPADTETHAIPGVQSLTDVPEGEPPPEDTLLDDLSPAVFRLGFSFVVGFAIAYAARTFLRISLVAAGVFLLMLLGLEYAGIISVNWDTMQDHYQSLLASARESLGSFRTFITGRLPSAGAALAGLVVGFRKR